MIFSVLQTSRLTLRPTAVEDAALYLKLLNTPKWLEYIGDRKVKTLDDAKRYIQDRVRPQFEKLGYGNYTLNLKANGAQIGCCGLYNREALKGVDIGFALLRQYENKGYAFEAAVKLRDLAFQEIGLQRIGAITVKNNTGSQKLLEKIGMQFLKTIQLGDDPEELMYYELESPRITA